MTQMTPAQLRALLRRRLPGKNYVVQCDANTTPPEVAAHGMVCAIVTWCPERDENGEPIDESFYRDDIDSK